MNNIWEYLCGSQKGRGVISGIKQCKNWELVKKIVNILQITLKYAKDSVKDWLRHVNPLSTILFNILDKVIRIANNNKVGLLYHTKTSVSCLSNKKKPNWEKYRI